jgi:hypothetical protein
MALLLLLVALVAMVGVLAPVNDTARIDRPQPEPTATVAQTDFPAPVAGSAIGDHYHEWSHGIATFRRGADTR